MAVSEVSICNNALALLAANRIIALGDSDSDESLLCTDLYPQSRDEVLESNNWTFATERVQLGAVAAAPDFGWQYKSLLPDEVARVIAVWEDPEVDLRGKYKREGKHLLTNFTPIYVEYLKKLTDPTIFSALCVKAIYTDLAAKLCMPLTENPKKESALQQRAQFYLDDAAAADGIQGAQERITSDSFIKVR